MRTPSHAEAQARADLAACGEILRAGSKSFYAASRLLPPRVRAPTAALYAFCRQADDAIDLGTGADRLSRLADRLERAYARQPSSSPVDRAFAAAVMRYRIPRAIPEALLEGFAWDAEGRTYRTIEELEAYCVRVAGTVGLMMALVMGVRDQNALARALDLGVAMQLTNIARDIGEDARAGRLYLPLGWLDEAGVDPHVFLGAPAFGPEIATVTRRLLATADFYYRRSDSGVASLPVDCRPAIVAARKIYSGIGGEIARAGFDSVNGRAVVRGSAKVWRLMAATASIASFSRAGDHPPVASGRPLLMAITGIIEPTLAQRSGLDARVGGLIDIFARLEQRALPESAVGRS